MQWSRIRSDEKHGMDSAHGREDNGVIWHMLEDRHDGGGPTFSRLDPWKLS
jgi:hypothetical protein